MIEVTWGRVTQVSPLLVRFVGDTADTPVTRKNTALTLVVDNRVVLLQLASSGGWSVAYVDGAS